MGLFFIAAGTSSKNRERTLDKPHSVESICNYLEAVQAENLRQNFSNGEKVYLWGANEGSFEALSKVRHGEYVVDVKNTEVVQIFTFCFFIKTKNTRLQEHVGWDTEKPFEKRRPYNFVYFLKSPLATSRKQKNFFQVAFLQQNNPQWLVRQKYFNDLEVNSALKRTFSATIEDFLGVNNQLSPQTTVKIIRREKPIQDHKELPVKEIVKEQKQALVPDKFKGLIAKVEALRRDSEHLERDHEDLVASLFELLGYERIHDIKFRRGNIDIRIDNDGKPQITIEVKADWKISTDSKGALHQAYNYANETGTRYVIITNGNRYCIYDRTKGLSYSQNLIADIELTNLSDDDLNKLERLNKGILE